MGGLEILVLVGLVIWYLNHRRDSPTSDRTNAPTAVGPSRVRIHRKRAEMSSLARDLVRRRAVVVDTETTGLGHSGEIVQIAVVDAGSGEILHQSLVRPRHRIPAEATAVHGIGASHVECSPEFPGIWRYADRIIGARPIVAYNAEFDLGAIRQSLAAWGQSPRELETHCLMRMYAAWAGDDADSEEDQDQDACDEEDVDRVSGSLWRSLEDAANECGIPIEGELHRAPSDALLARQLLLHLASGK
jgi:DNA polymerase-3 subunit epsilon